MVKLFLSIFKNLSFHTKYPYNRQLNQYTIDNIEDIMPYDEVMYLIFENRSINYISRYFNVSYELANYRYNYVYFGEDYPHTLTHNRF